MEARGLEDPHYTETQNELGAGLSTVCIDYATIGANEDGDDMRRLMIGRHKCTKYTFCHKCACKGTGDVKIVQKIEASIDEVGDAKIKIKSDGEPALVQVMEAVKRKREHPTLLENPPAHDPQSNGVAERAVREVKAQIRCILLGLEAQIAEKIDTKLAIIDWILAHAPELINRFLVGRDGKTAWQRVHNRVFNRKTFEFGEQVIVKPKRCQKDNLKRSLITKWREATWVGFNTRKGEHVVVLPGGGPAIRVRTARPRPSSERWSAQSHPGNCCNSGCSKSERRATRGCQCRKVYERHRLWTR